MTETPAPLAPDPESETNSTEPELERPWEPLAKCLESKDAKAAAGFLEDLNSEDQRRAMSRLSSEEQAQIVALVEPEVAADLLEHLPEVQAVDILEVIAPESGADIVEALPEDTGADLLRGMDEAESEALLAELDDIDEAENLRVRTEYEADSAGGLMTESFAAFPETATVGDVLGELSHNAEMYGDMDVQYVYVINDSGILRGVLRLRDLVLTRRAVPVVEIMIADPVAVQVSDDFEALLRTFDEKAYVGLPVVDESCLLVGVVTRQAVDEATADQQTEDYLLTSGIVGGEELRSMPMLLRCRRRLAWLAPNILLNIVAASVIAMYEDTLQAVIALAVFLPIVSDMSGCSGNQAVAVSMRELTLGLIRPGEYLRVIWKEGILGLMNGIVLGTLLGTIAGIWKDNVYLGLVIGSALALNTILSVLLGGLVPLLLKKLKVDPALASGPILTTCTDMCGFFLVLNLASLVLTKLT
ncbi:MAG: magnesium transporter [Verrucomicrobiales bacterium]|nr:magnesium transporter [Verrucomicrobiales bacterium]